LGVAYVPGLDAGTADTAADTVLGDVQIDIHPVARGEAGGVRQPGRPDWRLPRGLPGWSCFV